jgi:hypothetical protein
MRRGIRVLNDACTPKREPLCNQVQTLKRLPLLKWREYRVSLLSILSAPPTAQALPSILGRRAGYRAWLGSLRLGSLELGSF